MSITGILTALVTPFQADGSIDDAGIQRHVDRQVAAGIHGLVPLGTTGEFTTMTHEERTHVTEAVIEAAAGRIGVFPHTGAQSTAETIELSVHAGLSCLAVSEWAAAETLFRTAVDGGASTGRPTDRGC